jgi:hypothetical protein
LSFLMRVARRVGLSLGRGVIRLSIKKPFPKIYEEDLRV